MEFIDTHAHLTSPDLFPEIGDILSRAKSANVAKIVNICTDVDTLQKGLVLKEKYPWIYNTAATTPHDVEKEGEEVFPIVKKHVRDLVAIGETGLDYYYMHSKKEIQKDFFMKYLHLAIEIDLPIIIHCRDAFDDLFAILDAEYKGKPTLLHCFTGTMEEAKEAINRGYYVSFSGIVTFKNSEPLREVAKIVPLDRLLIETDSPYLAPQSKRGKVNEPSYLPEVAEMIASVKNVSLEEIAKQTKENAERFFRLR